MSVIFDEVLASVEAQEMPQQPQAEAPRPPAPPSAAQLVYELRQIEERAARLFAD